MLSLISYIKYLQYVFLLSYPCCKAEGNRNNSQQNQQQWGLQVKSLRSWPLSSFMCSRIQCHADLYLLSLSGILKTAPLSWLNVLIYWTSSMCKKGKSRKECDRRPATITACVTPWARSHLILSKTSSHTPLSYLLNKALTLTYKNLSKQWHHIWQLKAASLGWL